MAILHHTLGRDDFNFLHGHWHVAHRRLQDRLSGSIAWDDFDGVARCAPILGGQGNCDDNLINLPDGAYRAASLRSFDPPSGEWAIWWLDARNAHSLDVPMKGSFIGSKGLFVADDMFNGRPIKIRFLWSKDNP
ncbi:MAG: DUF1579 domain-containing protein, partial [Deltaproteobacteria bacterium]